MTARAIPHEILEAAVSAPARAGGLAPRCLTREQAARYLGVALSTIDRAIGLGLLPVVRLPLENRRGASSRAGINRRKLIDVRDLDALIDRSKEREA